MGFKRSVLLAAALVAGVAVQAEAQQIRLTTYTGNGTINTTRYGNVLASPYQGHFVGDPTTPLIDFYCIDFEHYAPALNTNYNVRVTNLGTGNVSLTRHGAQTGALARYQQIAWLIGQRPTVDAAGWRAIQLAVWQVFSGSCADTRTNRACARNGDAWMNAEAANWRTAALANHASGNYDNYHILTGVSPDGHRQEYMYVTPEPETYALMGTGLLFLLFAWRRRRPREDEESFATGLAGI